MRTGRQAGFTLIEAVVVIAVLAILAAVLTPYITRYIDDSRVARAHSDVHAIGGAMTNFYKDTGVWPGKDAAGETVAFLYTGVTPPGEAAIFTGAPPVVPPVAVWAGPSAPLDNSLLTNGSGNAYPANGEMRWKGPYTGDVLAADPWGKPYVVNNAPSGPIWVISAGSNLKVQTSVADNVVKGDDIGFRVR